MLFLLSQSQNSSERGQTRRRRRIIYLW